MYMHINYIYLCVFLNLNDWIAVCQGERWTGQNKQTEQNRTEQNSQREEIESAVPFAEIWKLPLMWKGRQANGDAEKGGKSSFSRCHLDRPEKKSGQLECHELYFIFARCLYISVLCLHKSEVRQIALECVNQRSWAGQQDERTLLLGMHEKKLVSWIKFGKKQFNGFWTPAGLVGTIKWVVLN